MNWFLFLATQVHPFIKTRFQKGYRHEEMTWTMTQKVLHILPFPPISQAIDYGSLK